MSMSPVADLTRQHWWIALVFACSEPIAAVIYGIPGLALAWPGIAVLVIGVLIGSVSLVIRFQAGQDARVSERLLLSCLPAIAVWGVSLFSYAGAVELFVTEVYGVWLVAIAAPWRSFWRRRRITQEGPF